MRCSQVIKIGDLNLYQGGYKKGNKPQERRVFLFDCLLLCCKLSSARKDISEYKLREKFDLKKMHVIDTPDSEGKWSYLCYSVVLILITADSCIYLITH